jgi:hypothetical protein
MRWNRAMSRRLFMVVPPALAALLFAAAVGASIGACGGGDDNGPNMKPGENCLSHHSFSAAGTVFKSATSGTGDGLAGATVSITDATGKQVSLTSNSVGNFYTQEALAFPIAIGVSVGTVVQKMAAATNGGCNGCHTQPPVNGAPGRIYVQ